MKNSITWRWPIIGGISLAALGVALFAQYQLNEQPCILCVYIRMAFVVIVLTCICLTKLKQVWGHALGTMCIFISAIWGATFAYDLYQIQQYPSPFTTCAFTPEFWVPADAWIPWLLQARGSCADDISSFLGVSLASWSGLLLSSIAIMSLPWELVARLKARWQ
jgi:disulfide bond formation protein DsbB